MLVTPVIVPADAGVATFKMKVSEILPQLLVMVYVIVALPAPVPVAKPVDGLMDATATLDDSQTPPDGVSVRVVLLPTQMSDVPEMAPTLGAGATVILL
jgi:hypothetical protein